MLLFVAAIAVALGVSAFRYYRKQADGRRDLQGAARRLKTFYTRDNAGNLLTQRGPAAEPPPPSSNSTSSSIPPPPPNADRQCLILDALGSVVALTDGDTGAVLGRYSYDPYGQATHSGTVTSRFQYASGEHDPQTGLTKFGTRYYNPALGRWTQRDPVRGNLANPNTLNPYAYAGNDPVNHRDPSGQQLEFEATPGEVVFVAFGTVAFIAGLVALIATGPIVVGVATAISLAFGIPSGIGAPLCLFTRAC
jgi:RHS repeat-associated protein